MVDNFPQLTPCQNTQRQITKKTNMMTKMTCNIMIELIKLNITLPFLEVVKIPQQRKNLLKALEGTTPSSLRIKATMTGN